MSKKLFDNSDESDGDVAQLGTNKDYVKSYNHLRKKELAKKLKDRGLLSNRDSASSNESEDSSEDEEVIDVNFDNEFLKTLSSLKSKNPAIYDKNTHFFETTNLAGSQNSTASNKQKPVTLKDYERKIILERSGKFEDDSDAEHDVIEKRTSSPTIVEEERRLRDEFKQVMTAEDSEEEEFGGIFKKRQKTKAEEDQEEEDYLKWLAGKKDDVDENVKQQLKPLKTYWSSNNLTQSERFLRDYVLNKGYVDTKFAEIPTYDEIVGDTQPFSEDEEELEKQAEFEQKYNFRYEDPDKDFIKRFPRTIENSVRRTDEKRKQKRQELKERKLQEKEQKMKEVEIIKEMKRKEIQDKIRKLKLITGNEELGFKDGELDEDFDPVTHDKRMQELFNDEYYQVDEGEEKPECPSDIEELKLEDWDNYDPKHCPNDIADDDEPYCEDEDFNMDCEYDPDATKEKMQRELIENTKRRKNRRGRKSRFLEIIQSEKPAFNPEEEKTFGEYIDEYYKLDCEDLIGDLPCRFKYVETTPNDFGLSIEEILLAKNKELNQWASLKKAVQIRPESVEKKEQRLFKLKAKNEELKRKIFKSLYGESSDEDMDSETVPIENANTLLNDNTSSKKKKRKRNTNIDENSVREKQEEQQSSNYQHVVASVSKKPKIVAIANTESRTKVPQGYSSQISPIEKKPQNGFNEHDFNLKAQSIFTEKRIKKSPNQTEANPFKLKQKPINKIGTRKWNHERIRDKKLKKSCAEKLTTQSKQFNSKISRTQLNGSIQTERIKAYGINPKKLYKKQKYSQQTKT